MASPAGSPLLPPLVRVGMNTVTDGMRIVGIATAEEFSDDHFHPTIDSAIKLQHLTKTLLAEDREESFKAADFYAKHFQGNISKAAASVMIIGMKFYRESLRGKLAERFCNQTFSQPLKGYFLQTLAKIVRAKAFKNIKGSPEDFAMQFVLQNPTSIIITKAINVYCRTLIISSLCQILKEPDADKTPEFFEAITTCYFNLPEKDRLAIETLVGMHRTESMPDPVYGKHYLDKLFEGTATDFNPLIKALEECFQSKISRFCDESATSAFFKIKNPQGQTRGYFFPTCYLLLQDYSSFSRKIQRALFKSGILGIGQEDIPDIKKIREIKGLSVCSINERLQYQAIKWGKPILSLKTATEAEKTEDIFDEITKRNMIFSGLVDQLLREQPSRSFFMMSVGYICDRGDAKGVLSLVKEKNWTIINVS